MDSSACTYAATKALPVPVNYESGAWSSSSLTAATFVKYCMLPYADSSTGTSFTRASSTMRPNVYNTAAGDTWDSASTKPVAMFNSNTALGAACQQFYIDNKKQLETDFQSCFATWCNSPLDESGTPTYTKFSSDCSCVAAQGMDSYEYSGTIADATAASPTMTYSKLSSWNTSSDLASKFSVVPQCMWPPCTGYIGDGTVFPAPVRMSPCVGNPIVLCSIDNVKITLNNVTAKNFSAVTQQCGASTASSSSHSSTSTTINNFFKTHGWFIYALLGIGILMVCVIVVVGVVVATRKHAPAPSNQPNLFEVPSGVPFMRT